MISKERLEELIKEEKTVYIPDDLWGTIGTLNLKKDFLIKEGRVHGELGDLGLEGASCSCSIPFEDLYETEEDAEFELEFGNITRTETLKLPTWEEFDYDTEFNFVDSKGFEWDLYSPDKQRISLVNNNFEHFEFDYSKENYIEACRVCKKLFLGGEDDKG